VKMKGGRRAPRGKRKEKMEDTLSRLRKINVGKQIGKEESGKHFSFSEVLDEKEEGK